jgi:hypothetical protein
VLLQRMANDPSGDLFNSPALYSSQPQGKFIYSPNSTVLGQAFQTIASQVLRLAK